MDKKMDNGTWINKLKLKGQMDRYRDEWTHDDDKRIKKGEC